MVTESYRNNKKVSSEGDEKPLTLPFKIQSGEKIAEGGESTVWQILKYVNKKRVASANRSIYRQSQSSFAKASEDRGTVALPGSVGDVWGGG